MKKIKYFLIFACFFFLGNIGVQAASNRIDRIDVHVYINQDASAHITEVWKMRVGQGTEVYKPMAHLGSSELTNFKVSDESGKVYTNVSWDINASFSSKAYKNGIHYTSDGFELCWGMSSYGEHTYYVEYDISNFVRNLDDGQMIYWQFMNDQMDPAPKKVTVTIESSRTFEDTVPVWGFGYKGYAYVADGKISMETEDGLSSSQYMVLYATFEPDTFSCLASEDGTKDEWLTKAKEGSFKNKPSILEIIFVIVTMIMSFLPFIIMIVVFTHMAKYTGGVSGVEFGTTGKKIDHKNIQYFRDLPCKKNIYRAYFMATLYGMNKKKEDFLGTIFLKWLKEEKIAIVETPKKLFTSSKNSIDLRINDKHTFDYQKEEELYGMLKEASQDGILENKEFEKWCTKHYSKILKWFDDVIVDQKMKLAEEGLLLKKEKVTMKIFKSTIYEVQPALKEEAIELAGLKKFLVDFSEMKNKEAIEVHLWQEYLMYAQIFGIANKVAKQFKNLYPDVITDMNYDGVIFVNNVAHTGVSHATSARQKAQSYSSGGGGFSSGGGGGGSFGGSHGGGCR